jgi:HD-GYP domain-containing protein (c-di-GMP phosphodiesterase class II)
MVILTTEASGCILDIDVYNEQGILLLSKGHLLNENDISFLIMHNIYLVDASPPVNQDEQKQEHDANLLEQTGKSPNLLKKTNLLEKTIFHIKTKQAFQEYSSSHDLVKMVFEKTKEEGKVDTSLIDSVLTPLLKLSIEQKNIVHTLSKSSLESNQLIRHSLNVGILSAMMAKLLKLSDKICIQIGKAGLFHDIGKVGLEKPDGNRTHPELGYNILASSPGVSNEMKDGALYHHENLDGSGFPKGLKKSEVPIVAQITAVANLYDNISNNRHANSNPSPYLAAIELMNAAYENKLNSKIVPLFVNSISPSFIGDVVLLSNGEKGEIITLSVDEPHRPTIRLQSGEFVNLKQNRSLSIKESVV